MRTIWIGLLSLGCGVSAAFWGCGDQPEMPTGPTSGPSSVAGTGVGGGGGMGGGAGGAGGKAGTGGTKTGTGGSDGGTTGTGGGTGGGGGDAGSDAESDAGDAGDDAGDAGGCTGTDTACGGTCPTPCAVGKKCVQGSDCATSVCTSSKCALLNGCDPATAADLTGTANATVDVPASAPPLGYGPPCLIVKAGFTTVVFNGDFSTYPLQGGVVQGAVGTPATAGTTPLPTTPPLTTGTTASFTFMAPGAYGFYCPPQLAAGMMGAVFAQ